MPTKSPYSHVIQPNSYVAPLDLNLYAQGTQYKEGLARQNLQDISALHNSLFNIPTFGKDREKLMEIESNVKQQMNQLNLSNLGNIETASQIKNLIGQAANTADVAGISQRYGTYVNELKKKEEAEAKGKQYVSPLLRQAEKYYGSGVYKTDERFNGSGFIAPDNEDVDKWAKSVPEYEKWIQNGAYDDHIKGKALGALHDKILQNFTTDPKWVALHNDNFNQQMEGQNVFDYLNNPAQSIKELLPNLPQEQQAKAIQELNNLQSLQNNPYGQSVLKNKLKNIYFDGQANLAAQAYTYANTVDHRVNDFAKSARDLQEAKDLAKYKSDLDVKTGTGEGITKEVYKAAIASGENIYNPDGFLIPVNQLKYNATESRDGVTTAKTAETKLPTKLKNVFETINSGLSLEGDELTNLTSYITTNRDLLGSGGTDKIKNVKYETKDGLKKVTWEVDDWGLNTEGEAYVVDSQEEYDKIPSGSIFIDSTGKPAKKQ